MSCGFTKVDLQNVLNIIDVCTQRGAFKAPEMSGVGQLYDKFKNALNKCNETKEEQMCPDGEVCKQNCDNGVCEKNKEVEEEDKKVCCLDGVCPIDADCERVETDGNQTELVDATTQVLITDNEKCCEGEVCPMDIDLVGNCGS